MTALLRALDSRGGIDLVVTAPLTERELRGLRHEFPRARVIGLTTMRRHPLGRLRWLTRRELPFGVGLREHSAARDEVRRFVARSTRPYDAVWCSGVPTMYSFGKLVRGVPLAVDFADVTWVLYDQMARAAGRRAAATTDLARVARAKTWVRATIDGSRWQRFERAQGSRAHLVTVCSATDREALGVPGVVVVPNGYDRPSTAAVRTGGPGAAAGPAEKVVLLAGQMTYAPNVDGARWFAHEVLPRLRVELPDVTLVIVGRAERAVEELAALDGVEVQGYVEDITTWLAAADAVVVPLRRGSGTRIKILEAFAHRIPVVSTSIGAEGLDVRDGDELLVADDATGFAAAVVRVLTDAPLSADLVERAARRYERDFDWQVISERFADRFVDMVTSATRYDVLLGDRASRRDTGAPR